MAFEDLRQTSLIDVPDHQGGVVTRCNQPPVGRNSERADSPHVECNCPMLRASVTVNGTDVPQPYGIICGGDILSAVWGERESSYFRLVSVERLVLGQQLQIPDLHFSVIGSGNRIAAIQRGDDGVDAATMALQSTFNSFRLQVNQLHGFG